MSNPNEIFDELKLISPLVAGIEKINVFNIPDGYFNGLAEKITAFAILNQNTKTEFNKNNFQHIPEGYFDTLSDQILGKIKALKPQNADEELQNLSPLLYSLKSINVFSIPKDYFENTSRQVSSKIQRQPAKIVSIRKIQTLWKYAAAAVLTGVIVVSSLQIFNSSPDMRKNNSVVTESSGLPGYIQSSFQYKTPQQVDEGISSLSDDEIIKYLEKHGNIMDNETLTKDVDTKELPTATDYLSDENALTNFLNTIDAKSSDQKTIER